MVTLCNLPMKNAGKFFSLCLHYQLPPLRKGGSLYLLTSKGITTVKKVSSIQLPPSQRGGRGGAKR
jgi:predicted transcriptional regulator